MDLGAFDRVELQNHLIHVLDRLSRLDCWWCRMEEERGDHLRSVMPKREELEAGGPWVAGVVSWEIQP